MKIATFVTEVRHEPGFWLCADYNDGLPPMPIAQFVSEEAAEHFTEILNLGRAVSHAQGALGI